MNIDLINIILISVAFATIGYLFLKLRKIESNYTHLLKGVKKGNLEDILNQHLNRIDLTRKELTEIKQKLDKIKEINKSNFSKLGFKRYNPFNDTGGDQSFVLVIMNKEQDGVIISSMHQRELTRVYAKPINKGKCKYKLSKEEKTVFENTL